MDEKVLYYGSGGNCRPMRPAPHFCHADGCMEEIPCDVFLCAEHFRALPQELRRRVSQVQVPGSNWLRRLGSEWAEEVGKATSWLKVNGVGSIT